MAILKSLPPQYPTHLHSPEFWENLGRTVATFGFLEEVLGRAIFSFTGTVRYESSEIEEAFEKWLKTLERALTDSLGDLINSYEKAVKENPDATIENLDELVKNLRETSKVRNVLCHGSWRGPDDTGKSHPLFVKRGMMFFDSSIDIPFLQAAQRSTAELACAVVSTVTQMGWQFPGTKGPGRPLLEPNAFEFSAFVRREDGSLAAFSAALSEARDSGEDEAVCSVACPYLRAQPFEIYAVDRDQALELAHSFIETSLKDRNLILVDQAGRPIEVPPLPPQS